MLGPRSCLVPSVLPLDYGVMEEPLRTEAAKGTLFEQTLRRMILGAVAWKLRGGEWRGRKDCEVCQLEELEKRIPCSELADFRNRMECRTTVW